jgi:hypothetical protein
VHQVGFITRIYREVRSINHTILQFVFSTEDSKLHPTPTEHKHLIMHLLAVLCIYCLYYVSTVFTLRRTPFYLGAERLARSQ